ncbi:TPA: glycosyltransferase family 1 protein, partial [Escherichia coli]|nr:glycosyltransferase family 1 protein [Escherichia coli]
MKKIIHIQVLPKMSGVQQVSFDILSGINDENVQKFILCGSPDGSSDDDF